MITGIIFLSIYIINVLIFFVAFRGYTDGWGTDPKFPLLLCIVFAFCWPITLVVLFILDVLDPMRL